LLHWRQDEPEVCSYYERIKYKLLSVTSHNKPTSISPQLDFCSTLSYTRSMVTLARPPTRCSLKITSLIALFGMLHSVW